MRTAAVRHGERAALSAGVVRGACARFSLEVCATSGAVRERGIPSALPGLPEAQVVHRADLWLRLPRVPEGSVVSAASNTPSVPPPPDPRLESWVTRDRGSHNRNDDSRIARLAAFNSERGRGIVHTEAWCDLMADEQEWFNQRQMSEMLAQGGEEVSPGIWMVPAKPSRRFWQVLRGL